MPAALRPDWSGRIVACIASGPSLTKEDCDTVRAAGCAAVVTNTSFRLAPWADVLFGFDSRWWGAHLQEVRQSFKGRLLSVSQVAANLGTETTYGAAWFHQFGNSGACAISLAVAGQASKVVLIGFDCSKGPGGEAHWHGNHPKGLTNCHSLMRWPAQFDRVAAYARKHGVRVINASRATALGCFERMDLERALT